MLTKIKITYMKSLTTFSNPELSEAVSLVHTSALSSLLLTAAHS